MLLSACSSPDADDVLVDPDAPVVAFYGDSYALGTGASDLANRWSTVICADRGWTEFNPSVNGLGFVNNRASQNLPEQIVAQDPDLVFVTMGLNDNFSYVRAGTGIRDRIAADFAYLTSELPDARVIVVEPFWYTDARPESVQIIIDWVREAADAIGADWIPGASRWIEGHPEWMATDGLHPNDAGYAEMARRMDAELAQLGL
ncbi:SGNH/GDSL hydrolase family protein [Pseudolysinimonas sp.]|jgi:lysophospholipase L1-like esterase|uniref:SGNH/GDSL hydrolase family protein n=1 Tax=Pseudolysinimonas sp. TaxID=2680009 RepID=UPI0037836A43